MVVFADNSSAKTVVASVCTQIVPLFDFRYEIVVVLEGIVEPTGSSIQVRSSYTPHEILWGYRFINILNYSRLTSQYRIDYSSFNKVYKVETPKTSAKQVTLTFQKKSLTRLKSALRARMESRIPGVFY